MRGGIGLSNELVAGDAEFPISELKLSLRSHSL